MNARVTTKNVRALAFTAVAGAAIWAISSFYLADSGSNTLSIQPASNLDGGSPWDYSTMSASLTRPNGNASLQAGLAIGRVKLIKGYGQKLKIDIAWLDPNDSAQVLDNPNSQIYVGLYHPVSEGGDCASAPQSVGATEASVVDDLGGGDVHYCTQVDPNATGSMMITGSGSSKLILSPSSVSGYIQSSLDDSGTASCSGTSNNTWCHPTALASVGGYEYNVLYVVLTIVTPGGKPAGQQNNLSSLSFYTQAKSV